jgi:pre-mRNA-processing factor 39
MEVNFGDGDDYEQQQYEMNQQANEDNGSSNFGYDENLTYEQQSNEKEETNQTDETTENVFIADLADLENANSFPSACDENSASNQMQGFSDGDYQMVEESNERTADKTEETFAQSEDTKPNDPDATDLDAENISEDELPGPAKPKVQDAEEVSDEELPGPKMAELPADTEVVSEDELPALKKEGKRKHEDYDPSEPTDEVDEKKIKTESEEKPKHKLPDLEKYWKAVNADKEDFNAWTYLLQYVDSESDVEAAREAYDSFLSRYCYCYGYWRKYADYEKKKGSVEKCDEVSQNYFALFYSS